LRDAHLGRRGETHRITFPRLAFELELATSKVLVAEAHALEAAAKAAGLPWAAAKGFDTSAPLSREVAAAAVPLWIGLWIRLLG
jgi:hypothetical protein